MADSVKDVVMNHSNHARECMHDAPTFPSSSRPTLRRPSRLDACDDHCWCCMKIPHLHMTTSTSGKIRRVPSSPKSNN